jgi:hypothetical protein
MTAASPSGGDERQRRFQVRRRLKCLLTGFEQCGSIHLKVELTCRAFFSPGALVDSVSSGIILAEALSRV